MRHKPRPCSFVEREVNGVSIFVDYEIIVPKELGIAFFKGYDW